MGIILAGLAAAGVAASDIGKQEQAELEAQKAITVNAVLSASALDNAKQMEDYKIAATNAPALRYAAAAQGHLNDQVPVTPDAPTMHRSRRASEPRWDTRRYDR